MYSTKICCTHSKLTLILWMYTRCIRSKFNQDGNVKSLSNPFHHMLGCGRHNRWVRWWKSAFQLHGASSLSPHLRAHPFSGYCRVHQKQNEGFVSVSLQSKSRVVSKWLNITKHLGGKKTIKILTKLANNCHHSESLQIRSCRPHICHSHNLQHVQSVGKRDTIVTIILLPWLHTRRQPSVTDFQN